MLPCIASSDRLAGTTQGPPLSLYIYIFLFVAGADMDACISSRIDDKPPQKKTVKLPWLLPTNRIAHARECSLLVTVIAFSRFVIGRVVTGITR
jgi:hypothetical protein